jgi:hypothetical protein
MPKESLKGARMYAWTLLCLRGALMAVSAGAIAAFLVLAWQRMPSPYAYDWIEEGMLMCVRRIHSGLPLYGAPGIYFTPYLYTPIYLYTAAALAKVTGVSYTPLRLLSTLATLGCFGALYAMVFRETRRHFAALAAVGLFAVVYPATEGSYDVGRVDMLYMLFVLCALYATRRMHPLFAVLLWVCAFQTKQGVLPIALLALCHDWHRPRRILLGVSGFVVMMGASIAWLTWVTGGWYRYYVFGMAGGFGYDLRQAKQFIPDDLGAVCGIALLLVVIALGLERARWRAVLRSTALSFYVMGTMGMVVFTGYIRAHRGANGNSLIPAYAWIAVLFGVALGRLYQRWATQPVQWMRVSLVLVLLAAIFQIVQQRYDLWDWFSSPDEMAQRDQFEAQMRSLPGDVMIYSHPEYARMAGKTVYASSEAIGSVVEARQHSNGDRLMVEYAALIHSRQLSAVVLDWTAEKFLTYPRVWMPRDFLTYYPLRVAAAGGDDLRFTSQPQWIYLPCPAAGAVDTARMLDPQVDESACAGR